MQRRLSWAHACGLALLASLLVRSLFVVPYLPTNDGPEHVAASYLEAHFGDPGVIYPDILRPSTEFASRGFSLIYSPLLDLLGWRLGLQVALAVLTLATAAGFLTLVTSLHPDRRWLAFLGFPLALTWELYMGFFPFAVGSAVGLFVLGLAVRWRDPSWLQRVLLGVLLLLQAICHVFTAALTGAALATLLLFRAGAAGGARGALKELPRVALTGLPAASVLAASALMVERHNFGAFARDFVVLPYAETLTLLPRLLAPGPWWRALLVLAVLLAAIVLGAARAWRRGADVTDRALASAGLAFVLAGAAAPINIPGWQFFSPRFLPLGLLLCLAAVPLETLTRRRHVALAASGLFALSAAWLGAATSLHRRLAAACADEIQGLSAPVRRAGLWLPITLAPEAGLSPYPEANEVPFLAPSRHLPMLYAVEEGGLPPYTFANSAATYPFVTRVNTGRVPPIPPIVEFAPLIESDAFATDARLRHRVVDRLARYGMRYEGVLVTEARPADLRVLATRGYVADWQQGSVFIGRFVPCPLELVIPADGDVPRVEVEVGAHDATPDLLRYRPLVPLEGPDGHRHLALPDAPCGVVRVRPHWEATNADGAKGESYCTNASPTGDLTATLTHTSVSLTCEGRDPVVHVASDRTVLDRDPK